MRKSIDIGDVMIPLNDFVISGTAWLGIKKAGKTYGAKGTAEQLIDAGVPLIVFDAIGVWRFLKTPGNGKGYKVVVAGGESPDIPLTAHNASEIVRAAMRANVSLVIDLYDPHLSKADWRRIVQTCFHTLLYENKKHGMRYIILEEAAEYVPQKVYDGETYAAVEKLVRMGGNAGLGISLINQRSQEVNKAVLDLCDNLVLMRQRGNAAIDAVQKWMDKVSPDIADKITSSLPNMTSGECWVWAENSDTPVLTRTKTINSYHPDRTKGMAEPAHGRSVDTARFVETLLAELPKVAEEKRENDPAELRKQVRDLQRQLAERKPEIVAQVKTETRRVEVPVLKDGQLARAERLVERLDILTGAARLAGQRLGERFNDEIAEPLEKLSATCKEIVGAVGAVKARDQAVKQMRVVRPLHRGGSVRAPVVPVPAAPSDVDPPTGGLRRMMIALANRPGISTKQVGIRAGLSSKSGTFTTYLGRGRSNGWIEGDKHSLRLTENGLAVLGSYDSLPEGRELLNYWLGELGQSGAARMLRCLFEVYPNTLSCEELGERIEMAQSGTFTTYLGKLRSLELVTGHRNALKASDELFD